MLYFVTCVLEIYVFIIYIYRLIVQIDLYELQHVQILDLYKLKLVPAPYLSVEQCILMNLYFKIHKSTDLIFMNDKFTVNSTN